MKLAIEDILITDRVRLVDKMATADLAASIKARGLINPITVWKRKSDGRYVLAAGEHRIEAYRLNNDTHIECTVLPLDHLSDLRASYAAKQVEIAENMQRKNLSYMEHGLMHDLAVRYANMDIQAAEAEALEAEAAARHRATEEARRKAEAEQDAAKRKELFEEVERKRSMEKNAVRDLESAQQRADNARLKVGYVVSGFEPSSKASAKVKIDPKQGVSKHGINKARAVVAASVGVSSSTIKRSQLSIDGIGGSDVAIQLRGTCLTTRDELEALAKLRKEYPTEAAEIIRMSIKNPNILYSASGKLGELRKEAKSKERDAMMLVAREDKAKAAAFVLPEVDNVSSALDKLYGLVVDMKLRDDCPEVHKMISMAMDLGKRLRGFNDPAKQKVTGTEHKYPVGKGAAAEKVRQQAKKDQDANNVKPPKPPTKKVVKSASK